jgi:hypothetical protein
VCAPAVAGDDAAAVAGAVDGTVAAAIVDLMVRRWSTVPISSSYTTPHGEVRFCRHRFPYR